MIVGLHLIKQTKNIKWLEYERMDQSGIGMVQPQINNTKNTKRARTTVPKKRSLLSLRPYLDKNKLNYKVNLMCLKILRKG